MPKALYLEDLFVGQRFRSGPMEITAEEIIRFARDNDPQFFHVDPEAAKESVFGGLIASGWQTGALSVRLLLGAADAPFAGGVVGADAQVSWKRPVRPGDSLHIDAEITRIVSPRTRADRGFVSFEITTFNQDKAPVQTMQATIVVFRDPARSNG